MDIKIDNLSFNSSNSLIFNTLAKCNGFLKFERTLNQIDNKELNKINNFDKDKWVEIVNLPAILETEFNDIQSIKNDQIRVG